jgi:DNA-binding response OmpR family regulator
MKTDTKTILIVDDEESVLRLITFLFRSNGYKVITATNGKEALEKIKTETPDLIILDYMMPKMDGVTVLKKIRKYDKETGILMVTGKGNEEVAVEVMKAGADDYVTKPFQGTVLLKKASQVLSKKKKELRQEKAEQKRKDEATIGEIATGCNEDVEYDGKYYHIQTEDLGLRQAIVTSTIFYKGTILSRKSVDYSRIAGEKGYRRKISVLVRKMHNYMKEVLLDGKLDDKIE